MNPAIKRSVLNRVLLPVEDVEFRGPLVGFGSVIETNTLSELALARLGNGQPNIGWRIHMHRVRVVVLRRR